MKLLLRRTLVRLYFVEHWEAGSPLLVFLPTTIYAVGNKTYRNFVGENTNKGGKRMIERRFLGLSR